MKLLTEYKAAIDKAISLAQTTELEDPKLLHVKITQLEYEMKTLAKEKAHADHRIKVI